MKIRGVINKTGSRKEIEKINITKSWFSEKVNEINEPLERLRKRREKTKITKIRNERGSITTNFIEIRRIIIEYCDLYSNKLDNLDVMDELLKTHKRYQD